MFMLDSYRLFQSASATTETQCRLGGEQEDLSESEQITPQQKDSETPPTYTQKLNQKT